MLKVPLLKSSVVFVLVMLLGCTKAPQAGSEAKNSALTVSAEPSTGDGPSARLTLRSRGPSPIRQVRVLVNNEMDGRNACYVYLDIPSKSVSLVQDSGEGSTSTTIGSTGQLENSQCAIAGSGVSMNVGSDGSVELSLSFEFRASFRGKKQVFGYAEDSTSANTGLQSIGTWRVPD